MAEENTYGHIGRWLNAKLNQLQQGFDQCSADLLLQSLSCPVSLSVPNIDSRLEEFVRLHHLDLNRKVNYLTNKFKDDIRESQLAHVLFSNVLTCEQVNRIRFLL